MNWIIVENLENTPNNGKEVVGFSPEWIDEDFNPKGTRMCFTTDAGESGWCSAKWVDSMDEYNTDYETIPTHICMVPDSNILK